MHTTTYQTEFIFNEYEYFSNLISKEDLTIEQKKDMLSEFNKDIYTMKYRRESNGEWYKKCFKNDMQINWNSIGMWIRPYIWEFETNNRIFHF